MNAIRDYPPKYGQPLNIYLICNENTHLTKTKTRWYDVYRASKTDEVGDWWYVAQTHRRHASVESLKRFIGVDLRGGSRPHQLTQFVPTYHSHPRTDNGKCPQKILMHKPIGYPDLKHWPDATDYVRRCNDIHPGMVEVVDFVLGDSPLHGEIWSVMDPVAEANHPRLRFGTIVADISSGPLSSVIPLHPLPNQTNFAR